MSNRQILTVSATLTKGINEVISKFFDPTDPNFVKMVDSKTHMNLQNLDHQFVHLAEHDKYKPFEQLLREFDSYSKKHKSSLIVFCNSI